MSDTPQPSPRRAEGEHEILEEFFLDLEELTGLRLCLYDYTSFSLSSPKTMLGIDQRAHHSPFCCYMKSCAAGTQRCLNEENQKTMQSARHPEGHLHTCYAGVTDFVLPVSIRGRHAGAVMVGQARSVSGARNAARCRKALTSLGLDPDEAARAYEDLLHIPARRMKRLASIARMVREYLEQSQELLEWKRGFEGDFGGAATTAVEAVRQGHFPLLRLHAIRKQLDGDAAQPIRKAITMIEKGYANELKHSAVSREVGMSISHFSREFHRMTGCTFRELLLETRLHVGLLLLKRYGIGTGEAGLLIGYADENSFRRAFHRFTGLSLRDYMRKHPRALEINRVKKQQRPV